MVQLVRFFVAGEVGSRRDGTAVGVGLLQKLSQEEMVQLVRLVCCRSWVRRDDTASEVGLLHGKLIRRRCSHFKTSDVIRYS